MGFIPQWALGVAVILIAISIGRTVSGLLRVPRGSAHSPEEINDLRQSLEAMQTRVGELEERVDFAERLLAKQRESARLGPSA